MAGAATQIYSSDFDNTFWRLPMEVQSRIQRKLDDLGWRLDTFPHYQMTGMNALRLRVGDYRIVYRFDLQKNEIYVGHRREVYR
jgi:mRNA-degrading endonuclease RelE of RelBE toxin-antitoxin system